MDIQFTPLKDFTSEELRSVYCAGLSYTIRPGNKKLAELVQVWLKEGKVRLGPPDVPMESAKVSGEGTVTETINASDVGKVDAERDFEFGRKKL